MFPIDPNSPDDDDDDVAGLPMPGFMNKPRSVLCENQKCIKRREKSQTKCIDCLVEEALPKMWAAIDDILAKGK